MIECLIRKKERDNLVNFAWSFQGNFKFCLGAIVYFLIFTVQFHIER
jgi:hypothetical protein